MNILKASAFIEKNEYQKLHYHFNFEDIFTSLFSGLKKYRFFEISRPDDQHISFKPKQDYFQLSSISTLSKCLEDDVCAALLMMNQPKVFDIHHKKKILCYLHMDWILAFQHLKDINSTDPELIEYLQFETGNPDIAKKIKHINGTTENRSNIYTVNKDSVIVNFIDQTQSQNTDKLTHQNRELIVKNPLLSFIEISQGFDNSKLTPFLTLMNSYCVMVLEKQTVSAEMKFSLKIRKIKRTNKKAMYIVNQNCILLDPRHVDSFLHELGHWYHTFFRKDIQEEKEAESFAEQFINDFSALQSHIDEDQHK